MKHIFSSHNKSRGRDRAGAGAINWKSTSVGPLIQVISDKKLK